MKQALPFMLIISLLSFVACNSEDKVGKDIPSAAFSMASRAFVEDAVQFTSTSYGGDGNYSINGISETGKNQPKKTPSTYMKTKESIS